MLRTVSRPENEAVSIHTIVLIHNFNLKNDLILKKSSNLTIESYDLESFEALINDDTCKAYIRVNRALKDCDLSAVVVSSK